MWINFAGSNPANSAIDDDIVIPSKLNNKKSFKDTIYGRLSEITASQ